MEDSLYTIRQLAERLAIRESTARLWLAQRRFPHVKLGRSVRIPRRAIEKLISDSTIPARPSRLPAARNGRLPDQDDDL